MAKGKHRGKKQKKEDQDEGGQIHVIEPAPQPGTVSLSNCDEYAFQ